MRLLMLIHRFPYPPAQGDCIRAWGELAHLAARHDVWLGCIDRAAPTPRHYAAVRRICRDVALAVVPGWRALLRGGQSLLGGASLTEGYFYDAGLAATLRRWSDTVGFDAVLTFSSAMAPYAQQIAATRRVLDMNDVDSWKWRRFARQAFPPTCWLYHLEAARLRVAERRFAATHDVCLFVNSREERKLLVDDRHGRTAVVRTGVDLNRYRGGSRFESEDAGPPPIPDEPVVGFVGSMSYRPNVRAVNWFGGHVWASIRERVPRARWLIVGRQPSASVRRWARYPGVTVTGQVDDVRPFLSGLRAFVSPVHDDIGVQTKLIEALAAGRAAVVTPQAAAGIDYSGDPPFLVARTPAQFADATVRLLRDDALARHLGRAARRLAEQRYGVDEQVAQVERHLLGTASPPESLDPPELMAAGAR